MQSGRYFFTKRFNRSRQEVFGGGDLAAGVHEENFLAALPDKSRVGESGKLHNIKVISRINLRYDNCIAPRKNKVMRGEPGKIFDVLAESREEYSFVLCARRLFPVVFKIIQPQFSSA